MKKLFLLFLVVACNSSTESKIKMSIRDIEQKESSANSTVENITVDSVDYIASSKKDYWINRSALYYAQEAARVKSMTNDLELSALEKDTGKCNAVLMKMRTDKILQDSTDKRFQQLISAADTSLTIYKVKYHLNVKTDKYNSNLTKTKFLNRSDLTEFSEN